MTKTQADLVTVGIWTALLLFFGWRLGAFGGAGRQRRRALAFAGRSGLAPEAVGDTLIRRVTRRQRFVLAGIALGLVAGRIPIGLARLVVSRRQAVGSPAELAADDALRAQAVRDALHLTAAISVAVAFVLSLALAEPDVDGPLRRVAGLTPLVLLFAIFVVGSLHELSGGPRWWRGRLRAEPAPA